MKYKWVAFKSILVWVEEVVCKIMILYICTGGMHLHLRLYSKLILETMILKYIRIPS